ANHDRPRHPMVRVAGTFRPAQRRKPDAIGSWTTTSVGAIIARPLTAGRARERRDCRFLSWPRIYFKLKTSDLKHGCDPTNPRTALEWSKGHDHVTNFGLGRRLRQHAPYCGRRKLSRSMVDACENLSRRDHRKGTRRA